jgi:hypothetical protein
MIDEEKTINVSSTEAKEETKLEVESMPESMPEPIIEPAAIAPAVTAPEPTPEPNSQQFINELTGLLTRFKDLLKGIFDEEKKSNLTLVAIALLSIPLLLLLSTILKVLDAVPLLAPTCELVGLGYLMWFVFRYLLFANTRQEALDNIKGIKSKILG